MSDMPPWRSPPGHATRSGRGRAEDGLKLMPCSADPKRNGQQKRTPGRAGGVEAWKPKLSSAPRVRGLPGAG